MTLVAVSSCTSCYSPSLLPEDKAAVEALRAKIDALPESGERESDQYEEKSYEYFVSHLYYLETAVAYRDEALLARADASCPVYICLSQQRGRLYVDGKVALDWPVSTGKDETPTSRGRFVILEKKQDHASGRFGEILDASGKVIEPDADSRKHSVPPGGRWKGADMPNWMRLTEFGIGMHTGAIIPGKKLSHGCIRMQHEISSLLFDILALNSRVYVAEEVEDCFPCKEALKEGEWIRRGRKERRELSEQLAELKKVAEERAVKACEEAAARRAELEEKERAAEEARERAEEEAEARAKDERRAAREAARAERARRKAEERAAEEARERAEEEAEAKARAEEEARERAEEEAEARAKAERRAAREAARAERARRKAEERAAEEARERAEEEAEAKARAEEEARERAEEEAEARAKAERRAAREAARAERARRKA
ncbi:MAG: L,D-transpeptidase, partial [Akkermansia sp.]|nr:L,D-transpeptidase [Akkermansia sp.]